jgi:hypothetical protein
VLLKRLVLCASILAPHLALADSGKGELDWSRRVLVGHGQGAPDLNAPSIAVARLGAERAAKLDAFRNALETLKGAELDSGGSVANLLHNDSTLRAQVEGRLKGVQAIKTHYFSDGAVSLDIEVPLDQLPPELAKGLKLPPGTAPLQGQAFAKATAPAGSAPAGADVITQTAQGQAAVLGGDKPQAREKAIEDALRHAVEMAVGTRVTSTTETQNFQTKLDQVMTHSTGFVKKYDLVKEGMDGDVVQVTVKAWISTVELDKDLEALGLLMARKNMPRTMVLIAEQAIGMAAPSAAWLKDSKDKPAAVAADLRIAETVILDNLKSGGFRQLIDPEIAEEKAVSIGGLTTDITAAQARKLGSLTHAEVILIGRVIATSRGDAPEELGKGWKTCSAIISGRAVNTDNGDILATSETAQNAMQLDDLNCGKEAIKKAAKVFTQDMIRKIGERWSQDVSGGNEVHLTVKKVASFRQASEFRASLTQFIRGVKGVAQRSFSAGTQELDVTLQGSTDQFAEELESKKLGKFSVKVTGTTANTVDVELGQQ